MLCPRCGTEVVAEATFCHQCGVRLGEAQDSPSDAAPRPEPNTPDDATAAKRFQESVRQVDRQKEPERELWCGGYSSKAMIWAWVLSGLSTLLLLLIGILWVRGVSWWILVLLIVAPWIYFGMVLIYRRWSVRYRLTSQRFVHELGILRRTTDRIEVLDMDDIAFEQNLIDRLVGVGTIRINSSDRSHPLLVLRGIDDVRRVSNLFDDARLAERRRRGLHIENI
ncbi:MAG: PH domain-containing protein [Pirellulales bacterium]|nr:PH domain-containing protein [Pirellulales bacterium]